MRHQLPEGPGLQPAARERSQEDLEIILEGATGICQGKEINPDWHLWGGEQSSSMGTSLRIQTTGVKGISGRYYNLLPLERKAVQKNYIHIHTSGVKQH